MPRWLPGVDWQAGDYLTEQRLDGQQGNADMLRDEARFRVIGSGDLVGEHTAFSWWARLRVVVGGNTLTTPWEEFATTGEWSGAQPRNHALTGLSAGTAYAANVFVDFDTDPGMGSVVNVQVGRCSFLYAEDQVYLSVFARRIFWTANDSGLLGRVVAARDFSLVITRENEGL